MYRMRFAVALRQCGRAGGQITRAMSYMVDDPQRVSVVQGASRGILEILSVPRIYPH